MKKIKSSINNSEYQKNWFSLIELIIVTTIIAIISTTWSIYFYSFLNNKEVKDKIYLINRDFDELDSLVRSYKISDYDLIITSNTLWYYYYTNYFDSVNIQNFMSIDFSSWIWVIKTNDILPWSSMDLKIYSNGKMINKSVINSTNIYTWSFNKVINNKISSTFSWFILNDIYINYFWEENLEKNDDNSLKLVDINTKEDKTWTVITKLIIKNIWKWKEIYDDLWVKYNEVYLFFTKNWQEEKLKVFTK